MEEDLKFCGGETMRLAFYDKDHERYSPEYNMKLNWDELGIVTKKLCRQINMVRLSWESMEGISGLYVMSSVISLSSRNLVRAIIVRDLLRLLLEW